jgi:hypothetical protein
MSLDEFTTDALAVLAAAGKADFEVEAQLTRKRDGSFSYWLTTWDPCAQRNPLDCHFSLDFGDTGEAVLGLLAARLGISYPLPAVVYATAAQKEDLQRLYNHPFCKRWEKTKMLLDLDRYTQAQAEKMLAAGPLSFRQELARREAAARGMAVTGMAELVQPLNNAA